MDHIKRPTKMDGLDSRTGTKTHTFTTMPVTFSIRLDRLAEVLGPASNTQHYFKKNNTEGLGLKHLVRLIKSAASKASLFVKSGKHA